MEGTNLELLQSTQADGQIAKFIQKRGQGIHHISFEVDDIQAELDRLKAKGIKLINEEPYLNAHKELVAFIHPKSTYGILIELIQIGGRRDEGTEEQGEDARSMESRIRVRDGE
jgi:methylmalonyl-CoA/ethylmalonyl-CoA epimerase